MTVVFWLLLGGVSNAGRHRYEQGGDRVLAGHAFVPLELVSWPFITTYFGVGIGGGLMQQNGVGIDTSGSANTSAINMAALAERINLSIGLLDWVALRGHFAGLMVSGASLDELLGFGAYFQYEAGGGAQVRIYKSRHLMLSAGVDFRASEGKLITPGVAVQQAMTTLDLDSASDALLHDISSWGVTPTVTGAVALGSMLGVQSSLGFDIGSDDTDGESESRKGIMWGIGLALDFNPIHVPIAFPFAYQLSTTFGDSGKAEHVMEVGAYYSGRTNLDLGLSFNTTLGDNDQKIYLGFLRMNYLW
jgi:hypothetical protein